MRQFVTISIPASKNRVGDLHSLETSIMARDRSTPQPSRRLYHLMMGLTCFFLYAFFLNRAQALQLLVVIGGAMILVDALRIRYPAINTLVMQLMRNIMRREELRSLSANSFFVIGLLIVTYLFPKPIVLLSVLYLAIGDPVAAAIGTRYGRTPLVGSKSFEGTAANFLCSVIATFIVSVFYLRVPVDKVFVLSFMGGFIGAAAEVIPSPVNDNLSIPVVSAILLSILNSSLGIF